LAKNINNIGQTNKQTKNHFFALTEIYSRSH